MKHKNFLVPFLFIFILSFLLQMFFFADINELSSWKDPFLYSLFTSVGFYVFYRISKIVDKLNENESRKQ